MTVALTGRGAADFAIVASTCGAALAAKGTCAVTVAFAPEAGTSGALTATLGASSTSGAKASASLKGTAGAEYSLGGTVAGLTGSGLTLSDGVSTLTLASGATVFSFPTLFKKGSAYAVTVKTQPTNPSQTCTVAGGSGTVGTKDVDVSVSCTTNAYTVGGTVVGLTGAGLTLVDDGSTAVIPVSGAFAFAAPVPSGSTYDVTIASQPTGQRCVVTGGTGVVTNAAVTSVVVNCTTASYPLSLTVYNGQCSGGFCALQCGSIPLVLSGSVSASVDAAGSYSSTPTKVTFPAAPDVAAGSSVSVEYTGGTSGGCTCSLVSSNIHAECAGWGCPLDVLSTGSVSGPLSATIYCEFPIQ